MYEDGGSSPPRGRDRHRLLVPEAVEQFTPARASADSWVGRRDHRSIFLRFATPAS